MNSERLRVTVIGISYSPLQSGAFALLLAVEHSSMRIPIIIGAAEAQSIAIMIERVNPPRPMTHDLFATFAHSFGVRLKEVYIYKFEEGIFSSEMTFFNDETQAVINSRTSDAIAIALRCEAPIYISRKIVDEVGIQVSEPDSIDDMESDEIVGDDDELPRDDVPDERLAISSLESKLARLIEIEDYEDAARIKRLIDQKKAEQGIQNDD